MSNLMQQRAFKCSFKHSSFNVFLLDCNHYLIRYSFWQWVGFTFHYFKIKCLSLRLFKCYFSEYILTKYTLNCNCFFLNTLLSEYVNRNTIWKDVTSFMFHKTLMYDVLRLIIFVAFLPNNVLVSFH